MISLDYLRTFKEFVECGSMAAAAKKLGITQPAVSLQLQKLEAGFPERLFLQRGNSKQLSPYGRALYESVAGAVGMINEQLNSVLAESALPGRTLRMAGREDFLSSLLARATLREAPGFLEIFPCSSADAANKVRHQEADLALTYHVPQNSDLVAKKVFTSYPAFVFSKRLVRGYVAGGSRSEEILRRALLELPLLIYRRDDPTLMDICRILKIEPASLKYGLVTPSWRLIQSMALQDRGLAIMPAMFVTEGLECVNVAKIFSSEKGIGQFDYYLLYAKANKKVDLIRHWVRRLGEGAENGSGRGN